MSLWFWSGYTKYAACIVVISALSIIENLYETVTNINSIRRLAHYECSVEVRRGNQEFQRVSSAVLVPGDIIRVPQNCSMPCDAVLLKGQSIMNESMLTGESIPVIK